MDMHYPSSLCPNCGTLVENVPPDQNAQDFCPKCRKKNNAAQNNMPQTPDSTSQVQVKPRLIREGMPSTQGATPLKCEAFELKIRCGFCAQKLELDFGSLNQILCCPKCGRKIIAVLPEKK